MENEKKDLYCGIVLEIFAVFILIFSFSIRQLKTATYDISSAVFPRICAGLLIFLGLVLIVGNARKIKVRKGSEEKAETTRPDQAALLRMAITLGALVLFVLCLKNIGFIICGSVLQFILMMVLAPKRIRTVKVSLFLLAISVVLTVTVDLLFVRVFYLMLPSGILSF